MSLKALFALFILAISCSCVSCSMITCVDDKMVISEDQQGECPFEDLGFYNSMLGELACGKSNWMSFLPQEMLLSEVSMPGTHDTTAMYNGR